MEMKKIKFTNQRSDDIFILSHQNKWGVYKRNSNRSSRNFKHRDLAFLYAIKYNSRIIVNNKNGTTDFVYENKKKTN
jgi:hypothetical protein